LNYVSVIDLVKEHANKMSEEATIEIYRRSFLFQNGRSYYIGCDIYLDGQHIDYLNWDEPKASQSDAKTFMVSAGQHSLIIKGPLWKTNTLVFRISPSEKKVFECSPASWQYYSFFLAILAPLPIFIFRNEPWLAVIFIIAMFVFCLIVGSRSGVTWRLKEL